MATLKVVDLKNNDVGTVDVADEVFSAEVNKNLFYEVVKMQLANRRSGTACTKTRGEIRGSTAKLFRQKGTGRARRGSIKSPTLRGGGTVFGPKPRSYAYRVPRKVRRAAVISAVSLRNQEEKLFVLENIQLDAIKTKALVAVLKTLGMKNPLIIDENNLNLSRSARNIKGVDVLPARGLNVYDILNHDELVMTQETVKMVEGALKS